MSTRQRSRWLAKREHFEGSCNLYPVGSKDLDKALRISAGNCAFAHSIHRASATRTRHELNPAAFPFFNTFAGGDRASPRLAFSHASHRHFERERDRHDIDARRNSPPVGQVARCSGRESGPFFSVHQERYDEQSELRA